MLGVTTGTVTITGAGSCLLAVIAVLASSTPFCEVLFVIEEVLISVEDCAVDPDQLTTSTPF